MEDLVDETRDGCQKITQRNPNTPKRIARTLAGEVYGLDYIAERPCESDSRAEATPKERTQEKEPPTHLPYDPCRDRETISNEHTLVMAQSNYGPLVPSMSPGKIVNEHIQSMSQSATHCFGPLSKSSVIATEGRRNTDPSASGSLESATGYQTFFKKRRLERNRPADPPLADPTSARHVANEHPWKNCRQDGMLLESPTGYRDIFEPRSGDRHQSPDSPAGPLARDLNMLNQIPERMNPSLNNSVELLMKIQSADPHPGPTSRMFKIPQVTPGVNLSASDFVEPLIRYRPIGPHPGPPSIMFNIPKFTQRVDMSTTDPVELRMEYQSVDSHPGPPSRMFQVPEATPRVNTSATNPLERPMEHQPPNLPPGNPTRPRMLADVDLQKMAAAAHIALESSTSPYRVFNDRLQGRDHIANLFSSRKVAAGTIPPPLPPSVEEAYKKKCIELKRRMQEVEESNDVFRVRKARLARGIRKMRLERAYLLEMLGKRMKKNGSSVDGFPQPYDEESDGSSEGPPTVFIPSSLASRPPPVKSLAN